MNTQTNGIELRDGARHDESNSLVVSKDPSFRLAMEPESLEALYKVATTLAKVNLCGVTTPEEALARLLTGRELGLTMMQSLRGVYIIEGQPSLSAALKEAICLAHPEVCEEFKQIYCDDEKATYLVKRRNRAEREFTYTIEQAREALLVDRGKDPKQNNWHKHRARMLAARCKGLAADTEFGDLLHGFPTREEMEDERVLARQARDRAASVTVEGHAVNDVQTPPEPVVSAPSRDFESELTALKEEISAAKTRDERAAVRKMTELFCQDAGGAWADEAKRFYNLIHVAAKSAEQATPPPGSAAGAPENVP